MRHLSVLVLLAIGIGTATALNTGAEGAPATTVTADSLTLKQQVLMQYLIERSDHLSRGDRAVMVVCDPDAAAIVTPAFVAAARERHVLDSMLPGFDCLAAARIPRDDFSRVYPPMPAVSRITIGSDSAWVEATVSLGYMSSRKELMAFSLRNGVSLGSITLSNFFTF